MSIREFIGLNATSDPDVWDLPVERAICGGRDSIFGGVALGAAIEVAEARTGRPATWSTCQFLRPAHVGQTVRLRIEVSAQGRAVSHTRVIGVADGKEVFISLVSVGERDFPATGVWATKPDVPGPEGLPSRYILASNKGGFREQIDERAVTDDPNGIMRTPDGRCALWITMPGGIPACAGALALIGDEVSTGTSAVMEPDMQAPSIDNTLRIVQPAQCDWVLADVELRAAARGFAHGIVNLWSPTGQLLGIATQTGALRLRGT
ncbi:MAG: thioesterase family protein [Gammaproteobacteria bacterium]|nr:thioesterase family protein [Gammaproteobacteria bacterium]